MEPRVADYATFKKQLNMKKLIGTEKMVEEGERIREYLLLDFISIKDYNRAFCGEDCTRTQDIKYICQITNPVLLFNIAEAIKYGICSQWYEFTDLEYQPNLKFNLQTLQELQSIIDRYEIKYHTGILMKLVIKDSHNVWRITDEGCRAIKKLNHKKQCESNYMILIDLLHETGGGTHHIPYILYLGYTYPNIIVLPRQMNYVANMSEQDIEKLSKTHRQQDTKFKSSP